MWHDEQDTQYLRSNDGQLLIFLAWSYIVQRTHPPLVRDLNVHNATSIPGVFTSRTAQTPFCVSVLKC